MNNWRHLAWLSVVIPFMAFSQNEEIGKVNEHNTLKNGSFTAELNGARIHYEVHGTGPVLMVLPNAWGINIAPLRRFYRQLESKLTVVYFDPRGMGASEPVKADADMSTVTVRRDFDALRGHLGLQKVNAIGWSNGAMNLLVLASEKPETIAKAVFLHGTASFNEEDNKAMSTAHPEVTTAYQRLGEAMKQTALSDQQKNERLREVWLNEYVSIATANPEETRPKVREFLQDCPLSWRHFVYSLNEWPKFDARDRLPRISAASLILAGAKDSIPVAKAEEMKRGIPNSTLVVFENSGHFSPLEEPAAFQREVLSWLAPASEGRADSKKQ